MINHCLNYGGYLIIKSNPEMLKILYENITDTFDELTKKKWRIHKGKLCNIYASNLNNFDRIFINASLRHPNEVIEVTGSLEDPNNKELKYTPFGDRVLRKYRFYYNNGNCTYHESAHYSYEDKKFTFPEYNKESLRPASYWNI